MEKHLLRQFQREVERQCRFALFAVEDADHARDTGDGYRFWFAIQNLLTAAGRISYLLWPAEEDAQPRGQELRQSLRVEDSNPFKDRELFKHFEHFDQRLQSWDETSEHHRFFDSYSEPLDVLAITKPEDRFRGYDTEKDAILFHGQAYPIQPLADAAEALLEAAQKETQKPRFVPKG